MIVSTDDILLHWDHLTLHTCLPVWHQCITHHHDWRTPELLPLQLDFLIHSWFSGSLP